MKYRIEGEPFPVVICDVEAGEKLITQKGAMSWMSPNMKMETVGGGIGKMFGRMFSGESMFQNHYTAQGGPGQIAFAASFPGSVRAIQITPDNPFIVQKKGFLFSEASVQLSTHFQKGFSAGFFGGDGGCGVSPYFGHQFARRVFGQSDVSSASLQGKPYSDHNERACAARSLAVYGNLRRDEGSFG